MVKKLILLSLCFVLSGCGVAYISPDVKSKQDGSVQIVTLDTQSAKAANASPYSPQAVPAAFFQNAGSGGGVRGAGVLPQPVLDAQHRPRALVTRLPPEAVKRPYTIGIGDVVILATKTKQGTVEQLTGLLAAQNNREGYTVQDDGAIALPDVGRIALAGLTLAEAETAVFRALVNKQFDPSFSLEISKFNSQRVSIGGAVAKPATVPITLTGLTLGEALTAAGGIKSSDPDYTSVRIYRDGGLYQIPLREYLRRGELQKTRLIGGDSVFVDTEFELAKAQSYFQQQITLQNLRQSAHSLAMGQLESEIRLRRAALTEVRSNFKDRLELDMVDRDYVYITGEVNKPGRFDLPFGRQASLADALYSEGGFNAETGNPSQIYVLRGQGDSDYITAYHLNTRNVVNMVVATKFEMRPNDIIFVAEQPITRWNRVVQQIVPSLITTGVAAATN